MVHYQRRKIGAWKDEEVQTFSLCNGKNSENFSLSVVLMNENYQDKEVSFSFIWLPLCNLLDVEIETK